MGLVGSVAAETRLRPHRTNEEAWVIQVKNLIEDCGELSPEQRKGGVMYAAKTMFTMPPGVRPQMEGLADKMLPMMKQLPGFVSVTFVMNEETNEYGGIAMWETREHAETAMQQTGAKLDEALAGSVIGPLRRSVYEVYEPKP